MSSSPAPSNNHRPIRWWPAVVIVLGAIGIITADCFRPPDSQQALNMKIAPVIIFTIPLLLLWVVLFSRMQWKVRFTILGLTVAVMVLMPTLFRFHGVSGNLVPILEPRWAHKTVEVPVATATPIAQKPPPGEVDFPQFFGPHRDGHLDGPQLATNWTTQLPAQLWRRAVGAGWSGFAVAGALAITQEQRGDDECVIAYDLQTGSVLWSHADKSHYANALAGEGPRATPTIAGKRVFTQGATGMLNCLDLADGHVLWATNIFAANGGSAAGWGQATSPLVLNDLVIVSGGGEPASALAAYHIADGSPAWAGGPSSDLGYSSPLPVTIGGTNQILLFADSLLGSDAATGKILWKYSWPGGHPHVAMPLLVDDTDVIIASGYGTGSSRIKIAHDGGKWNATKVWRTNRMKAKFANMILYHGHVYGLDDGIMECVDAATGALAWKDGRYGHGQILLVGQWLLVMAEDGGVILLDPQPDQLRELTRFTALHEKTWNPPALAGEYLLVRNDKEAACFRLPVQAATK